jgi:hypothetical protein
MSTPTSTLPRPGKGGRAADRIEQLAVDGEALGRSRGGLTSKIHLAVDGRERPMSIIASAPNFRVGSAMAPPELTAARGVWLVRNPSSDTSSGGISPLD